MSTETAELTVAPNTNIATLPPAARAAVVLKSEQTRKDLVALAAQSAGIVTVLNADGREQAHRVGMTLKNARVTIEKTGKAAREDATAFSKAVIAEENALIGLIEPEETRVLKLRDEWDEKIAAEKAAKIAAERARVEGIQGRIEAIRRAPLAVVGESSAAILVTLGLVRDTNIDESFAEFSEQAMAARSEAFNALEAAHAKAVEAEAAARAAEEARKAEAARLAAERAELARQREEQAETARLAKVESDRIAAEQAAEGKRIADLAAAQEAELRQQREAEAARVRAEDEARAAAYAEQQAAFEVQRAAFAREQQEAAQREDDRVRLQSLVEEARADVDALPASLDELMAATFTTDDLPLAEPLAMPESVPVQALIIIDSDIIRLIADAYGIDDMAAIDRLESIDFAKAREAVAA